MPLAASAITSMRSSGEASSPADERHCAAASTRVAGPGASKSPSTKRQSSAAW